MTLCITSIGSATPEQWDAAVEACPHATFFQTREWTEIWADCFGARPTPKLFSFSDGTRLVLPGATRVLIWPFLRETELSPAGTFGGPLYSGQISLSHLRLVVAHISGLRNVTWRENPYDTLLRESWPTLSHDDETHAIALTQGIQAIQHHWARGKGAMARKIRKAEKSGLRIRLATSEADWRRYYEIYEESLLRWGPRTSSAYGWPLLVRLSRGSQRIRLWLAEVDSRLACGAICFYQNTHVAYWHGATSTDLMRLRGTNLLHARIIANAAHLGAHWYDFNPSGGHAGVAAFKQSFGAISLQSRVFCRRSKRVRLLEAARKSMNRVFSRQEHSRRTQQ
jgi:hypothetical protein